MSKPFGSPPCFPDDTNPSSLLWSAAAPECVGGHDPAYNNPQDQSHRRERCGWYQRCADSTNAIRTRAAIQHAPVYGPVQAPPRPIVPPYPLAPRPVQQGQYPQQQQAPGASIALYQGGQLVPPHVAQYGPQLVATQVQQVGAQMPSYLTVPEPYDPNVPWYKRLFREVFRSSMKSTGHTVSSFIDHTPFAPHNPTDKENE